jgi:hypothetical protein
MKKSYAIFGLLTLILCMVAVSAFDMPDRAVTYTDEAGQTVEFYAPMGGGEQRSLPLDTMSAAGTTYVYVPWNMKSAYQYQYFFKMRKIAGTPNVKIRLEERNNANSAIWSAIDSVSVSGADSTKLFFRLRGGTVYGAFHRIAFVKTGTNTIARNIEFNIKATE